jgi:hypothetical protein
VKVFHLPTTVGGNPQGLSRHLRELGVDSVTMCLAQNYFAYPADIVLWDEHDGVVARELARFRALLTILRQADVVHFNFGSTLYQPTTFRQATDSWPKALARAAYAAYLNLMQTVELAGYRLRRISTFVHYQGDDARQGDYCLAHFEVTFAAHVPPGYYSADTDALKRRQIRRLCRHCDAVYAVNPDLLHVLPEGARFQPYGHVSPSHWLPRYDQLQDRPLRIGHAPSHRAVKGTDRIVEAVEQLRAEGWEFEFVLIEGLSNEQAKAAYEELDLVVDQIYAGWYGGLAVEVMALGKPVVAYIRHDDLAYVPAGMRADLPIIEATPPPSRTSCATSSVGRGRGSSSWDDAAAPTWRRGTTRSGSPPRSRKRTRRRWGDGGVGLETAPEHARRLVRSG